MERALRRSVVICGLLLGHAIASWAAPADEIKTLIEKGNSAAAYNFGKSHPDQLGIPAFDFYFGVAAIDTGHAGEGVLALERYTINFPSNQQARLELARGYFILGEDARAREEFNGVLSTNPPPAVTANIDRYLDAIRARESTYRTTTGAFVEFGVGYDSNINGGVSSANINLPNFGLVTIAPAGVKTGSTFMQVTGGASITHPVSPGFAVFGSARADAKLHHVGNEFDQDSYGASGGASYLKNNDLFRGTLSFDSLDVDYNSFRDVTSMTGEWQHQLDELQALNGFLQYAQLDYKGANDVRDSRLYSVGGGYRRALIGKWRPQFSVSGTYSKEDNRRSRDDFSRNIYGLRVAVSASPAPKWAVGGGFSYQLSDYDAADPLFTLTRRDQYYAADAAVSYALTRKLSIRGELLVSKNQSNIDLFEYKRNVVAVKARYEFR